MPNISADGRTIVFMREPAESAPHIFAIEADGSNLRQITRGSGEESPSLSADGKMLAYSTAFGGEIWARPLDRDESRKLTDRAFGPGRISPDGAHVAFLEWQAADRAVANLKVVPVAGGPPILDLPWSTGTDFRWHPLLFLRLDGRRRPDPRSDPVLVGRRADQ